ncbi:MAG: hypothetical protein JWN65_3475 [Solirubrobacterales bacterium]|nr:hypothetical protein [Solirubrobacterales bacterium]
MTARIQIPARPLAVLATIAVAIAAGGCGRAKSADQGSSDGPRMGVKGTAEDAAADLGFPAIATKNTTRVAGADAIADAAAVTRAVYPGGSPLSLPEAVALVDVGDWRTALVAASLNHAPINAPTLFTRGSSMPPATSKALTALAPRGSKAAGGAQVVRVGTTARPGALKTTDIRGANPFALARSVDAFVSAARGGAGRRVLLVSAENPAFAAPAAAYAAKSGDPILFTNKDAVPPDTIAAIKAHDKPTIYILGPSSVITPKVTRQLKGLGRIVRTGGADPVANSIEFARFSDGGFGWGIVDPGHGMVFLPQDADPTVAAAAAPLSASGAYGPALLLSSPTALDKAIAAFLLDIQPGYAKDPVRGVYNRGWLIGDTTAIAPALQSAIDRNLEITRIASKGAG